MISLFLITIIVLVILPFVEASIRAERKRLAEEQKRAIAEEKERKRMERQALAEQRQRQREEELQRKAEQRAAEAQSTLDFYVPRLQDMRNRADDLRASAEYHRNVRMLDKAEKELTAAEKLEERIFRAEQKIEKAQFILGC